MVLITWCPLVEFLKHMYEDFISLALWSMRGKRISLLRLWVTITEPERWQVQGLSQRSTVRLVICAAEGSGSCCGGNGNGKQSCSSHESKLPPPGIANVGAEFENMVSRATMEEFEKEYDTGEVRTPSIWPHLVSQMFLTKRNAHGLVSIWLLLPNFPCTQRLYLRISLWWFWYSFYGNITDARYHHKRCRCRGYEWNARASSKYNDLVKHIPDCTIFSGFLFLWTSCTWMKMNANVCLAIGVLICLACVPFLSSDKHSLTSMMGTASEHPCTRFVSVSHSFRPDQVLVHM